MREAHIPGPAEIAKLTGHPKVTAAWEHLQEVQETVREGLFAGGPDAGRKALAAARDLHSRAIRDARAELGI